MHDKRQEIINESSKLCNIIVNDKNYASLMADLLHIVHSSTVDVALDHQTAIRYGMSCATKIIFEKIEQRAKDLSGSSKPQQKHNGEW